MKYGMSWATPTTAPDYSTLQTLIERKLTLAKILALPCLESGHFDNLIAHSPTVRVWLSRMTVADGAEYDNAVTVEELRRGVWTVVDTYQATECAHPMVFDTFQNVPSHLGLAVELCPVCDKWTCDP